LWFGGRNDREGRRYKIRPQTVSCPLPDERNAGFGVSIDVRWSQIGSEGDNIEGIRWIWVWGGSGTARMARNIPWQWRYRRMRWRES
jgi:hypothetical protein